MKTNQLLTVLSLFLLVPASITWAQITKTLNGTVSYRSGMSETKFSTPNGNVVVNLPQSMSGSVITGTVSAEPAGKTEKEKNKNLKALLKMVVNLDGQKIPLSASPSNFDWLTHIDRSERTPMELLNVSGHKIGELSLPPVLSPPATNPGNAPQLTTPSNIIVKGDALNIYTDHSFTPGEKFVLIDAKGQQFTVKPICLSSNQAVIPVPDKAVPGEMTVTEEVWNQPSNTFQTKIHFKTVDIQLTSPNTNLRPGQNSEVLADVVWISPDIEDLLNLPLPNFNIDLKNLNPNTVTMQGGNLQRVKLKYFRKTLVSGEQTTLEFRLNRNIIGNAVGAFSVSATLHEDYNTSNDPFRPQLNVLKTPGDFNAWTDALKKDLKEFARMVSSSSNSSTNPFQKDFIQANVKRAIDNMPVATNGEQLNEAKAIAYSLVKPLNIPKGAAISWLSSYEAFKAAAKAVNNSLAGNTELIDYDVMRNGIEFINRVGIQLKDGSLQLQCSNTQQLLGMLPVTGETKDAVYKLKTNLDALISSADKKINQASSIYLKYTLEDLIISSYQLASLAPPGGVHPFNDLVGVLDPVKKILNTTPDYKEKILASLNAVPQNDGSYQIQSITVTGKPISYLIRVYASPPPTTFDPDEWRVKWLTEKTKANPNAGTVILTAKDSTGTWYRFFKDAECGTWSGEEPKEQTSECSEINEYIWKEDGSHEEKPTGKYHKISFTPIKQCKKGTNFCTEVFQVWRIEYIYDDKNCSVLRKVETEYEFGCK